LDNSASSTSFHAPSAHANLLLFSFPSDQKRAAPFFPLVDNQQIMRRRFHAYECRSALPQSLWALVLFFSFSLSATPQLLSESPRLARRRIPLFSPWAGHFRKAGDCLPFMNRGHCGRSLVFSLFPMVRMVRCFFLPSSSPPQAILQKGTTIDKTCYYRHTLIPPFFLDQTVRSNRFLPILPLPFPVSASHALD